MLLCKSVLPEWGSQGYKPTFGICVVVVSVLALSLPSSGADSLGGAGLGTEQRGFHSFWK